MSVISSRWIRNDWGFCSLWRSCFNKSPEVWKHVHLVALPHSGICLTLSQLFSSVQKVSGNFNTGKNYKFKLSIRTFPLRKGVRIRAIFREASTKSWFILLPHCSQKTKVVGNDFQEMPQIMPFTPPSAACNMSRMILMGMMLWFQMVLRCPGAKWLLPNVVVPNRQCAEGYGFNISSFGR